MAYCLAVMLTPDVAFEDFDQQDWRRLVGLFGVGSDHSEPPGGIVALTRGGQLRKLLTSRDGAVPVATVPWPALPEELSERFGTTWAIVIEQGALEELLDRWATRLAPDQDLTTQSLDLLRVARELEAEGMLTTWPRRIASVPLVSEALVSRGLDLVCPDGKGIMLGAFEGGHVFTALVAQRRGDGFCRLVGPERLRLEMGLASGDWTHDCHRLARAAELAVGELSLGCFAEATTFRALLGHRAPGAWATAVARRDVVLHPLGPAVALPLGLDVGRAAYRTVRDLASRLAFGALAGGGAQLGPTLDRVRGALPGQEQVSAWLGFDPMRLLRELLEGEDGRSGRD